MHNTQSPPKSILKSEKVKEDSSASSSKKKKSDAEAVLVTKGGRKSTSKCIESGDEDNPIRIPEEIVDKSPRKKDIGQASSPG